MLSGEDDAVVADSQPPVVAAGQCDHLPGKDAGFSAYCSILAMIRSLSRSARRRISLIAHVPHSICIPSYTPSVSHIENTPSRGRIPETSEDQIGWSAMRPAMGEANTPASERGHSGGTRADPLWSATKGGEARETDLQGIRTEAIGYREPDPPPDIYLASHSGSRPLDSLHKTFNRDGCRRNQFQVVRHVHIGLAVTDPTRDFHGGRCTSASGL